MPECKAPVRSSKADTGIRVFPSMQLSNKISMEIQQPLFPAPGRRDIGELSDPISIICPKRSRLFGLYPRFMAFCIFENRFSRRWFIDAKLFADSLWVSIKQSLWSKPLNSSGLTQYKIKIRNGIQKTKNILSFYKLRSTIGNPVQMVPLFSVLMTKGFLDN